MGDWRLRLVTRPNELLRVSPGLARRDCAPQTGLLTGCPLGRALIGAGPVVTKGMQTASIAVNARLAGFYSAPGSLLCRDALGAAEVRRAYLNERFRWDGVAVQRKRGGQAASAPVGVGSAEQAGRP